MLLSFETGPISGTPDEVIKGQEFNAYTLFGDLQPLFIDLLRYVEFGNSQKEVNDSELLERLGRHVDRGARLLIVRLKSPKDAAELLSSSV